MMFWKSCRALAFLIAAGAVSASASNYDAGTTVVWKTVVDQHGSSVMIPFSVMKRMPDPLGLTFKSKDGTSSIQVWTTTESRPDFPGHNPKDDMNLKRADCDSWPPKYYRLTEKVASYSCLSRDHVNYYLARYSPSGSVTLLITYPVERKKLWDQYVRKMAQSLRQVERHEVR